MGWLRKYRKPLAWGVVALLGLLVLRKKRLGPERYHLFDELIKAASQRHGVPVQFIRSVIKVESDFQPYVRSGAGAMGLMQIMPATADRCGIVGSPFEPTANINCGVSLLSNLIQRYHGDLRLALYAYNAGPGRVDDPPSVTVVYADRILALYGSG